MRSQLNLPCNLVCQHQTSGAVPFRDYQSTSIWAVAAGCDSSGGCTCLWHWLNAIPQPDSCKLPIPSTSRGSRLLCVKQSPCTRKAEARLGSADLQARTGQYSEKAAEVALVAGLVVLGLWATGVIKLDGERDAV